MPHFAPPSLHDALPISGNEVARQVPAGGPPGPHGDTQGGGAPGQGLGQQRFHPQARGVAVHLGMEARSESTRLNSSHLVISYAVFCLKKKSDITNKKWK